MVKVSNFLAYNLLVVICHKIYKAIFLLLIKKLYFDAELFILF